MYLIFLNKVLKFLPIKKLRVQISLGKNKIPILRHAVKFKLVANCEIVKNNTTTLILLVGIVSKITFIFTLATEFEVEFDDLK